MIPDVELNLLLQQQNAHEVPDIIAYARQIGVSVQIIELVGTGHNAGLGEKISSAEISGWLRSIASSEQVITAGTGQGKRVFTIDPVTIEVIDASLGRHHVGRPPPGGRVSSSSWKESADQASRP
jgi:cyclic pyranopterin phosphate synthase